MHMNLLSKWAGSWYHVTIYHVYMIKIQNDIGSLPDPFLHIHAERIALQAIRREWSGIKTSPKPIRRVLLTSLH